MGKKKWALLLDYIYPPRCPVCGRVSPDGICAACRKKITPVGETFCLKCGKPLDQEEQEYCSDCERKKHYFDAGRSLFSYQGDMRRSLYRLKYGNKREYAAVYGREMAKRQGRWIHQMGITLILPVPLHRSRKRQRGYNQAALLARELGRCIGIPVREDLLFRKKKTAPLKTLTGQARRESLRGAFGVSEWISAQERILLVDDIYTTGSTADAAALSLKKCGCRKVFVITVATGG